MCPSFDLENMVHLNPQQFRPQLAYATTHNFMHKDLYTPNGLTKIYVHSECAERLNVAARNLESYNKSKNLNLHFVVFEVRRSLLSKRCIIEGMSAGSDTVGPPILLLPDF